MEKNVQNLLAEKKSFPSAFVFGRRNGQLRVLLMLLAQSLAPRSRLSSAHTNKEGTRRVFMTFFFTAAAANFYFFSTDILFLRSHFGARRRCRGSCCRSRRHLFIVVDCKFYSEKNIKFSHSPFGRLNFFVVFIFYILYIEKGIFFQKFICKLHFTFHREKSIL